MKKRQRQGSVGKVTGLFETAILRVWSLESLTSLRPFYEIHGVQPTFTVLLRYDVTFHYVDICNNGARAMVVKLNISAPVEPMASN